MVQDPSSSLAELLSDIESSLVIRVEPVVSDALSHAPGARTVCEVVSSAHNYPLSAGGKRVRPLLLRLTAGAVGGATGLAISRRAGKALELVHTYSLVHDDLPCMDDDDFRRGKPTTHKVYGDARALLVGDGLLTQAFEELTFVGLEPGLHLADAVRTHLALDLVAILARHAGPSGMVLGQWCDVHFTNRPGEELGWHDLEFTHLHKTAALLAASLEMGLLCGLAGNGISREREHELRIHARKAGLSAGLAFQIVDDLLDASRTTGELGKTAGKDEAAGKLTAVKLLGTEKARLRAEELTRETLSHLEHVFTGTDEETPAPTQEKITLRILLKEEFSKLIFR